MNLDKENLYKEHFNDMCKNDVFSLNEIELNLYLQRIIDCLPNGKLYKYRNFTKEQFDFTYNALNEGYLWLSYAKYFNDKRDMTINYNPLVEIENYQKDLLENPRQFLLKVCSFMPTEIRNQLLSVSDETLSLICNCFKQENSFDKYKLIELAENIGIIVTEEEKVKLNLFEKEKNNIEKKLIPNMEKLADFLVEVNNIIQSEVMVYCFTDSYTNDGMWSLYSNNNNGYCIEYDLNKAFTLPIEEKRKIINIFRVKYEEKKLLPILNMIEWHNMSSNDFINSRKEYFDQLLVKDKSYNFEREWRIVLARVGQKFFADLVSAIIIDESVINTSKAKKLVELANRKGWNVIERKLNVLKTCYLYEQYH